MGRAPFKACHAHEREGGLTLIIPGWQTDLIGLVIVGGISAYQILTAKRENNAAAA